MSHDAVLPRRTLLGFRARRKREHGRKLDWNRYKKFKEGRQGIWKGMMPVILEIDYPERSGGMESTFLLAQVATWLNISAVLAFSSGQIFPQSHA
jgi:hypothetical protein